MKLYMFVSLVMLKESLSVLLHGKSNFELHATPHPPTPITPKKSGEKRKEDQQCITCLSKSLVMLHDDDSILLSSKSNF